MHLGPFSIQKISEAVGLDEITYLQLGASKED